MKPVVTDFQQFTALRTEARGGGDAALREAANQFEAIFLQTMLKSMRDASMGDPIFGDSNASETYQDLFDKQMAMEISGGRGLGFADLLVRQLGGRQRAGGDADEPGIGRELGRAMDQAPAPAIGRRVPVEGSTERPLWQSPAEFVRKLWPYASRAADRLNVDPRALIAQAALETGWGKHVTADENGRSSLNLFGIKASGGWQGDAVSVRTIEYRGGAARPEVASFRAYPSLAAGFDDYARLLGSNPRYENVLNRGDDVAGYAEALQASGYATDPAYADKIKSLLGSETMGRALESLKFGGLMPIDRERFSF
ncbi:flagellar assembly peptidoglycan hydrolase FlgJ [Lentisalinibacter salinarum]|uniref:flagellar assembly peptidoglycan hydrolase FlgJ n=1 Tax=Lentisalinibacter salinarum TaxID=2992239 RepID=UPI003864DBAC